MYSESDQVRVIRQWEYFQGNLRMGVVSVSFSTCQRVCHVPEPARRLSAQLPLSCNKTQYFGSDRSPRRGNLVCLSVWDIPQSSQQASRLGLVVSEIFETRLSGYSRVPVRVAAAAQQ